MLFYILFYGFLAYLFYKLVFNFILPVYRTTKQIKKSFREMQENAPQQNERQANETSPNSSKTKATGKVGDYIDFEEVQD
jgi:hypothetical protein